MQELNNYLNEKEIKNAIYINEDILELKPQEIKEKIELLLSIDCSRSQISNIIICNPMYLSRSKKDLVSMMNKLVEIEIDYLSIFFDSNPFFLNYDKFESVLLFSKLIIPYQG
jgi:hypothetical protein